MKYIFSPLLLSLATLVLANCATPVKEPSLGPLGKYLSPTNQTGRYDDVDISMLVSEMKFSQDRSQMGFRERPFNTCKVKANKSKRPMCKNLYLGALNFRLLCRNNTGLVQQTKLMKPLIHDRIRWKRGRIQGFTHTDNQGYGQVYFVADRSSLFFPLKFYMEDRITYKRLRDNWKIVLPQNWCSRGRSLSQAQEK